MMMTSFRKYCHYDVKFLSYYSNSALRKKLKYISNNSTAALSWTEKSCKDHLANKCPAHFVRPETRTEFWMNKIDGNVRRDDAVNAKLKEAGWRVLRFWELKILEASKALGLVDKEPPKIIFQDEVQRIHKIMQEAAGPD